MINGETSNINAPKVQYTCCDFYGPMSIAWDAIATGPNPPNEETRFEYCTFNEEYQVNGTIYSFTSDCVVPDPDNFGPGEDCDLDEPLLIINRLFLLEALIEHVYILMDVQLILIIMINFVT